MKKRNKLQEDAGARSNFAHRVIRTALGKQAAIKREIEEEWVE